MIQSVLKKSIYLFIVFFATTLQSQNSHLQHFTVADGLPQQNLIDLSTDQNGYLWIVATGGEIVRYDGEKFESIASPLIPDVFTEVIISYNQLPTEIQLKINKGSVNKIIKDRQSNIWIATTNGLFKLVENNFEHFYNGYKITAIHSYGNKLFAGTSNELIEIESKGNNSILRNISINSISNTKNEQTVIGSENAIFIIDFDKVVDTLKINGRINKLLIDGKIWAATTNGIYSYSYDYKTKSVFNLIHFNVSEGIYDLEITDIQVDRIGRLWYVSEKGFLGYIDKNIVKHIGKVLNIDTKIGSMAFYKTKLFLGTHGNGVWWSEVNENLKFNKLIGDKKLYSEYINQLMFDSKDNLWIGTHKGVDKVLLDYENKIIDVNHFGKSHGFLGIETTRNTITEDKTGNLWFGTVNGLMKYEPSENNESFVRPKIYFENVEVVYNSIDTIDLRSWENGDKTLVLKPSDNHISFRFKTIDLNHPNEIQYSWRLNTENWSPWTKDRRVNYSSLNAGNHIFEVKSRIINSQESDSIKFRFNIGLPFYKKLWVQLLIIGILLLIGWLFLRNYLKKLKIKNQKEQEKLQLENNLLSLEQKALRLQMNPHFIFNVLNGIKSMGSSDTDKMNSTINKFATLLRLTLNNSRKDHISLAEEIKTLENYIEVEQLMHEKSFSFTIEVISDIDTEEILIPPMLLQPFVENAIRHGILPLDREGVLNIKFENNDDDLHCSIKDNGVGVFYSQSNKTVTDHQSMALQVTKERIESLSGENSFKIEELKDAKKQIKGTKIWFKIPLLTDY